MSLVCCRSAGTSSRQSKHNLATKRIFFGKRFPAVAVDAQGTGENPSVHKVGVVTARHFALAITVGRSR
jgi:hypothetical protein